MMAKCNICDKHDEIYLADRSEYYDKKYTVDIPVWSRFDLDCMEEEKNITIEEDEICYDCFCERYENGNDV